MVNKYETPALEEIEVKVEDVMVESPTEPGGTPEIPDTDLFG